MSRDQPSHPIGGALGLKGMAGVVANLSAVGLAFLLLFHLIYTELPRTREAFHGELRQERDMYASELKATREHDQLRTDKILVAITDTQRSISDTQKLLGELAAEVRRVKLAVPKEP